MERSGTKVEGPVYSAPMMRKFFPSETYNRRLLLMAREVVLAVAVTIAALVFIFAVSQPEPPEQIGVTAQRTVQK